ncbi:hypothetical protein RHGRI_033411 [Rhododendron griersonianum]|uniref:DUF4283 domain-containing protein n=1 Tax=Rhododendron griersonianum TaxID=479676 RepID=A0AAV6HWL7_9ERIC|nr:hypothetical protein RHGRI_033411 [Rhododendron griersonianum]
MDSGILVSNAIVGGTLSSSTCVGDMVVNLDLISSSPFTAPVLPMYNSPVGLNSGGIGEPRVSPVSRASSIVNPCPSGNIVDLLEQVTVPHRDHLPPCATTSPTAGQNNDGARPRLSHIASSVGHPLYADQMTESGRRLSYAKICVEVDCSSPLPESFDLKYADGDVVVIRIQYPWKPQMCSVCQVFGHNETTCPSKVKDKKQGNGGVDGAQGKTVQDNEWQVVRILQREARSGLGGSASLQAAQASTSAPTAGMQLPINVLPVNGESFSGPKLVDGVSSVPIQSEPDIPGNGRPLGKRHSVEKEVSEPSRFAVLDALGLNVEGVPIEVVVTLPDEASVQGAMLTSEIGLNSYGIGPDFPDGSQSKATPIAGAGKKAKGKGGGRDPSKGRARGLNNPLKQKEVRSLIVSQRLGLCGVLGWDPCCLDVSLVYSSESSDQLICVKVTCLSSQRVFYASVVYGANSMVCRRSLWSAMRFLFSVIGDSPWIQLGDFNVALRSSERVGRFMEARTPMES